MDEGAPLALWNADCLSDPRLRNGQAPLLITEGEWDAIAAIQSGCPCTVSVPNGAPGKPTQDIDTAKRYDWVDRHAADLAQVREFILATDDDPAGHNLRDDLVALLGAERCRFVEYPFPAKDLNEVLQDYGQERLMECILTAKPFPVKGLYRVSDFPEKGDVRSYSVGVAPISDMIHIVPGTLTVVTGYANSGKSTLLNCIIGHAIANHFPVCVASFETDVKPILVNGVAMAIGRCSKHELPRLPPAIGQMIEDRMPIITQAVDEDLEMDLDEFLRLARLAVIRHGVKMIVLDPWNEMEHKRRRDESETDYTGRALRKIKHFAKTNDVAFWIIAHPTKPQQGHKGPPSLYDISGSANWANKADYGITYHRPKFDVNEATVSITKIRMGLPGARGDVRVAFDFRTSAFVSLQ